MAPVHTGPRTAVAPFPAVPAPGLTEHPSAPLPDVAPPAGPRTSIAPFQAVPAPAPTEHPSAPLPDVAAGFPLTAPADAPDPTRERSAGGTGWDSGWREEPRAAAADALWSAAPPAPAPAPAGPAAHPAYVDWTRPSGPDAAPAPATTAIPDREVNRGRQRRSEPVPPTAAIVEDEPESLDRLAPATGENAPAGPTTGGTGVVGSRAADRAERQAADAERRRVAKKNGVRLPRITDDEDEQPRRPRRRALAVLAVVLVALAVLGVYSFTSPATQEASDGRAAAAPTTSAAPAPPTAALPPLTVDPLPPVDTAPAAPVRVPVTVLNATSVTGLAADVAEAVGTQGWTSAGVGAYEGGDVPVTTVFFTAGNEEQRQSALQMVDAFPGLVAGPAERFFEVPGVSDPGLVVVAAGDWRP
ncbi:LytR C-terminal domain-containing protein [Blastococcus sp. SYSU D00820]